MLYTSDNQVLIVESGRLYSASLMPNQCLGQMVHVPLNPQDDWLQYFATKGLLPQDALPHLTTVNRSLVKWLYTVHFVKDPSHPVTVLQDTASSRTHYLVYNEVAHNNLAVVKAEAHEHRIIGLWVFFNNTVVVSLPDIQVADVNEVAKVCLSIQF